MIIKRSQLNRVIVLALAMLIVAGIGLVYITSNRETYHRVNSLNNLRELGQFSTVINRPKEIDVRGFRNPIQEIDRLKTLEHLTGIPAGTVLNPKLKYDERISWVLDITLFFDQRKVDSVKLIHSVDREAKWNDETNLPAAKTLIPTLLATNISERPDQTQPIETYYPGIGGIGADAASLPAKHPRAGSFRYDQITNFEQIGDGLKQSILFIETKKNAGPWLQGGPSTVRTINPDQALIGDQGQLGGVYRNVILVAHADGSASTITSHIAPKVFLSLVTINGGADETGIIE